MKKTSQTAPAAATKTTAAAPATETNVDQTTTKTTAAAPATESIVTLAEICKELNIKPQSARVKLRRLLPKAKSEPGFRWVFPLADKQKIIDLLQKAEAPAAEAAPAAEGTPTVAEGTDVNGEAAPSDAGEPVADEPLPAE